MFKFKNPDNSETKSVKKKGSPKFKNDINKKAPFSEWIYRLFMLLAFLSIVLVMIYLGAAGIGIVVGYFTGSVGVRADVSVIEMLNNMNLYTLIFSMSMIAFFIVLIILAIKEATKGLFKFFVVNKIGKSFAEYKK